MQVSNEIFDVEDIFSKYRGESIKSSKTLLEVFKLHNKRLEKLVGKGYSLSTLKKFYETEKHIKSFIFSINVITCKISIVYRDIRYYSRYDLD